MNAAESAWSGRTAAIATRHGKEEQFGPALRQRLGLELVVADVDTDQFGTFTGEIPRNGSAVEIARSKALLAVAASTHSVGLASEGSFGPHPDLPFFAVDAELVLVADVGRDLEIVEHLVSASTNYASVIVDHLPVPSDRLEQMRFPDHALVVTPQGATDPAIKAIRTLDELERAVSRCLELGGAALVQTDMRAHMNPTRQAVLVELAAQLAERMATTCSSCDAPGWGLVGRNAGRPCLACDTPTALMAAERFGCASRSCDHEVLHTVPEPADPGHCPRCNP